MSKIKFAVFLLGALLISNADLQATETPAPESQITKAEADGGDNSDSTDAVEPPQSVTGSDLQGLSTEVGLLRDELYRRFDRNTANSQRSLKIGGTLTSRYSLSTYTNTPPYASSFALNSATLSLSGSLKKDYGEGKNLNYLASFQAASTAYNLQPTDVYLQYYIFPSLDTDKPLLYLQFGQQKRPFGLEPLTNDEKQPAVNTATFAGAKGLNLSQRDIGIQLRGDLFPSVDLGYGYRIPLLEYSIGVFNGSGPNTLDTNQSKDVVGRIVVNAPVDYNSDFRGLSFGSSFYKGEKDLVLSNGTVISGGSGQAAKDRYGLDLSYVTSPIGFTAEYAVGKEENLLSGNNIANAVKSKTTSSGYTVTLFYEWGEQFLKNYRNQSRLDDWWPTTYQPFIRFDHWDPNTAVTGNEWNITTYGFNLFFAETTKLQLNYVVRNEKSNKGLKQNDFVVQFQYGF